MAESSRAAAKRQRRQPQPQQQQEQAPPGSPPPRQPAARVIYYEEDPVPPEIMQDEEDEPQEHQITDHPLLRFAVGSAEYEELHRIVGMTPLQHRTFSRPLLEQLGRWEDFMRTVSRRWRVALSCFDRQYDELTFEFYSTFRSHSDELTDPAAISFSLGRQVYQLSIQQFAVHTGFYTAEEVQAPAFATALIGPAGNRPHPLRVPQDQLTAFWATIANPPVGKDRLESSIHDPFIRFIHRIIACSILGRRSGVDKVSRLDLFCLYCIIGQHEANLASVLLASLERPRKASADQARLPMGPYISRLARSLGVFERYPPAELFGGPMTDRYSLEAKRLAGMCEDHDPPRFVPIRQGPLPRPRRILRHQIERPAPAAADVPEPPRQRAPTVASLAQDVAALQRESAFQSQILMAICQHLHIPLPPRPPAP